MKNAANKNYKKLAFSFFNLALSDALKNDSDAQDFLKRKPAVYQLLSGILQKDDLDDTVNKYLIQSNTRFKKCVKSY